MNSLLPLVMGAASTVLLALGREKLAARLDPLGHAAGQQVVEASAGPASSCVLPSTWFAGHAEPIA